MPKVNDDSERKISIDVSITPTQKEEADEMAVAEGWNRGEFYRLLFIEGLAAYAEKSNKRRINKRLRMGQQDG